MAIHIEIKSTSVLFVLVALSVLGQYSSLQEDVFVLEDKNRPERKTIVIVTKTDEGPVNCVVLSNKMLVKNIVSSSADYTVEKLSGNQIRIILKECATLSKLRERRDSEENDEEYCNDCDCNDEECDDCDECQDMANSMWNIIFPGTKWCGRGSIASNSSDLGILKYTDTCCRSHDQCNDTIPAGETKHNITNNSEFTMLSCKCDDDFYDCLEHANTIISNIIGRTFFNILKQSCYTRDYPKTDKCKTYTSFLHISCAEYERNTTVPKVYMLRDAKRYTKLLPNFRSLV